MNEMHGVPNLVRDLAYPSSTCHFHDSMQGSRRQSHLGAATITRPASQLRIALELVFNKAEPVRLKMLIVHLNSGDPIQKLLEKPLALQFD